MSLPVRPLWWRLRPDCLDVQPVGLGHLVPSPHPSPALPGRAGRHLVRPDVHQPPQGGSSTLVAQARRRTVGLVLVAPRTCRHQVGLPSATPGLGDDVVLRRPDPGGAVVAASRHLLHPMLTRADQPTLVTRVRIAGRGLVRLSGRPQAGGVPDDSVVVVDDRLALLDVISAGTDAFVPCLERNSHDP